MNSSDHFDGKRFFNPSGQNAKGFTDLLLWQVSRVRRPWPDAADTRRLLAPPKPRLGETVVTWINHATFLIQTPEGTLLTDPIWSERCSPLAFAGPKRVRRPALDLENLPPIDIVLVSHDHYDHMDLPTLRKLQREYRPLFLTGLGNARANRLRYEGPERIEELDWWQSVSYSPGLRISFVPAQHFSARGLGDRNSTLWGAFYLQIGHLRLFFGADSGYGPHFKEIRDSYGAPDLALLPIGAYEPRWFMQPVHMDPGEAVQAAVDLEAKRSIPMHYGTFPLADEGLDDPPNELRRVLAERGLDDRWVVLAEGESWTIA